MSQLEQGGRNTDILTECRIAAVGRATVDALRQRGVRTDFLPDAFLGSELATSLDVEPGDRVLLPRAEAGGHDLPRILRERGAAVDDIAIYRTIQVALDSAAVARLSQGVDVITFASGSAVRSFTTSLSDYPELSQLLDRCSIACIGPRTAEVVREIGYEPSVIAETHTADGLVQAMDRYFGEKRHDR